MKQRTYLIIFVKQTTYLITLPDRSPASEKFQKTKRNLFCATPLRSRDLIRLVRLLRTFLHAAQPARRMSCLSILILGSSTKTALNLAAKEIRRHDTYSPDGKKRCWIHIIRPPRTFRMAEYDWGSANLQRREASQCFCRQVTLSQSEIWKKVNGTRQLSVSRPFSSLCEVRP
jgi:hypothetical protein